MSRTLRLAAQLGVHPAYLLPSRKPGRGPWSLPSERRSGGALIDEVAVTASRRPTNGALDESQRQEPELRRRVEADKAARYEEAENDYEEAVARHRELVQKLDEQQAIVAADSADARAARRLQQLERDVQAADIRAKRAGSRFSGAIRAAEALNTYFYGREIEIESGPTKPTYRVDSTGKRTLAPTFDGPPARSRYAIKGRGYGFADEDEAAYDAIALARAVGAALGDNRERVGFVRQRDDGTFSYGYDFDIRNSFSDAFGPINAQKAFSIGRDLEAPTDRVPARGLRAMWHTHPIGGMLGDQVANLYLGEGDLDSARTVAKGANYPGFQTYLGASDGFIRKVPNINNPSYGPSGKDIPHDDYLIVGPGRMRVY